MKEYGKGAKGIDMSLAIKISNRVHELEQPAKPAKEVKEKEEELTVEKLVLILSVPTLIFLADIIGGIFHLWN
jgi:hypothetical protein